VNFYWVGDGQYRNEITSRLEKFENFKWLGRLDYPEGIRKFLESIDVYALITGMDLAPLTLKEAQVMEKPVLATDVGGDKEMMIDGETGFLVREGNAEDIILRITELLDNKETAKEMGIKGARFVKKKFNWEVVTKEFLKNIQPYVNSK
jgi:glycosyltransferase involved in cell wall biosynthesis